MNLVQTCAMYVASFALASQVVAAKKRPPIPVSIPKPTDAGPFVLQATSGALTLNLIPELSLGLESFIRRHGNHIAAVVVIETRSGKIVGLAQGRHPHKWNASTHSALFNGFPAASIFKTVPTTALIDIMDFDPDRKVPLWGGCAKVRPDGRWLSEKYRGRKHIMTLERAFADSCNSFFAKIAIQHLGLGLINSYAQKYRWGQSIPTDFNIDASPIFAPSPGSSSVQTVGKYSAGFGDVGVSAIHAAWIYHVIANDGVPLPIRLFARSEPRNRTGGSPIFKPEVGPKLRAMMNRTIRSGTAASAFRKRGYRHLIAKVGGKTGTLTGKDPRGLTTWFTGMMPFDNPEVAVAAVVVTGNKWVIKGPHLAAEAFRLWHKIQRRQRMLSNKNAKKPATL